MSAFQIYSQIRLNRILRGWAYAHRKVVAKTRMAYVDSRLYHLVRKWLLREHRSKTWGYLRKKYYKHHKGRFNFSSGYTTQKAECRRVSLFRTSDLPIRYHNKVKGDADVVK